MVLVVSELGNIVSVTSFLQDFGVGFGFAGKLEIGTYSNRTDHGMKVLGV